MGTLGVGTETYLKGADPQKPIHVGLESDGRLFTPGPVGDLPATPYLQAANYSHAFGISGMKH